MKNVKNHTMNFCSVIFVALPLVVAILFMPSLSHARSNCGFSGYPDHECAKPYKPYEFRDSNDLERYQEDWLEYVQCIDEYVENAQRDIDKARRKMQDALSDKRSEF